MVIDSGADVVTGGDHIFDNFSEIYDEISKENSVVLRPHNFDGNIAGKGYTILEK